ncbi:MAG: SufD family Fe-S cluster assembly protein [Candidatus Peribacteria bacterium]|jgi:Fe-S cluster assembly scaffold protein SufB|nr:SufD family Fe-S cluster assembly protein [Candidatus Peribacteria bacterium]
MAEHIDIFTDTTTSLTFDLGKEAEFYYAVFLQNSQISLTFITSSGGVKARIFAFVPAVKSGNSSLSVNTKLSHSHIDAQIHLIAIQDKDSHLSLEGDISIEKDVEKVSAHLLEEVLLLEGASYTHVAPILKVASPDVQASHGAKVHKISVEQLFYLQSRGLDYTQAMQLIIFSYQQYILNQFDLGEEERRRLEKLC